MRCLSVGRVIRRCQEEIQVEDKVQKDRVQDLQVEIHQPLEEALGTKEAPGLMKYQLAQIVKRSIGYSVAWEARLVIGVAKKDTKLKTVRRKIKHKKLERQC